MFRTLVKTERRWRSTITTSGGAVLRAAHRCAARGATARRSCSAPGDRIILDDDSVTNLEAQATLPRAGDDLQPDAGARARGLTQPVVTRTPRGDAICQSIGPSGRLQRTHEGSQRGHPARCAARSLDRKGSVVGGPRRPTCAAGPRP